MIEIGRFALITALIVAGVSMFASVLGISKGRSEMLASARRGVLVVAGLVVLASLVLLDAILGHNFQLSYVYEYTSRDMNVFHLVTAFWAGNEGSMLMWALFLSIFGAIVVFQTRKQNRELAPYIYLVFLMVEVFFLGMLVMAVSPFKELPVKPADGMSMNPLLLNPGMIAHPPTLYLGYVGFTVPFAFAIAALASGNLSDQWIRSTRRWTLFAWMFLSLGNLLGSWWAYRMLEWGGFWGWDPVENASFMPWLVGTAYLHSVMIQQRRGMLKVWNIVLIMATFLLTIFGTFLTRSGVLQSVHSFGKSSLGSAFLGFIAFTIVACITLLIYRWPKLKSDHELDSLVSRESSFLTNNVILVGATFATFFGTMFPVISEWVRGVKVTVGPPFFDKVNGHILLLLIVLMGICPLIGWRRASRDNLIRNFLYPALAAGVAAILMFLLGIRDGYALLAFTLCGFVIAVIALEVFRGALARHRQTGKNYLSALGGLVWRNKPRYGGYIVHLSIIMMGIAIVAATFYNSETTATGLKPGESTKLAGYTITYRDLESYAVGTSSTSSKEVVSANLDIYNKSGDLITTMNPGKTFYNNAERARVLSQDQQEMQGTEIAIRSTPKEDLYISLAGWDQDKTVSLKIVVNPMVMWLWVGGFVLVFGTMIAFWPDARERRRAAAIAGQSPDVSRELDQDET